MITADQDNSPEQKLDTGLNCATLRLIFFPPLTSKNSVFGALCLQGFTYGPEL